MSVRLAELAGLAGAEVTDGVVDGETVGVALDARQVRPGWLFAALPGTRVHGAEYAAEAAARGAMAVLTDPTGRARAAATGLPVLVVSDPRAVLGAVSARVAGDPTARLAVAGITGTSGKTTTSYLVETALAAAGRTVGLIGTTGTRVAGAAIPTALTTPEAPVLQELFAHMVDEGAQNVVMEVSSHALSLGRVDGTHFAVAAFLNLSRDHLDFHPDMEHYLAAKSRLFATDSAVAAPVAVVCVDDEWGRRVAELAGAAGRRLVLVATGATPVQVTGDAIWTAGEATVASTGEQSFEARRTSGGLAASWPVRLGLPGRFNVANALVALAVADELGVAPAIAAPALAAADVPGRLERVDVGQDFLAVVDYAHKPAAVAAVVGTLREENTGRLAVVLGAGGDRDTAKRGPMGEAAARHADLVVVTDDNPRSEEPVDIRAAVLAGARVGAAASGRDVEIREIGDRAAAIAAAVAWARPGDVVLVAGKGHESGQDYAGEVRAFDDRVEVRRALLARGAAAEEENA